MARNERAQWAQLHVQGVTLLADLAAGISLARTIEFSGPQLRCFGAAPASSRPLVIGDFTGRVDSGAGCNCSVLTLTPHANGTHTEAVGHLTVERVDAHALIPRRLLIAALVSIEPELAGDSGESSSPVPHADDLLITRRALERAWPPAVSAQLRAGACVIRTQPNLQSKFAEGDAASAPFLSAEAARWLVESGIEHLILDVPSADRYSDGGELTAHRVLFGLPRASRALADAQRAHTTITELAYVPDAVDDGWYFLSLQAPAIAGDAVPSRPVLYPLRAA
ncbi:MAG TPA: cyclase family protein [Steroidobacteraceae bacterium]|jgi:kynurenine formamidase